MLLELGADHIGRMTTHSPRSGSLGNASAATRTRRLWSLDGLADRERKLLAIFGLFLLADLIVIALYVVDSVTGRPIGRFVDLNQEYNLPALYSSAQLFVVGAVLAFYVWTRIDRRTPRSWLLLALPLIFFALAADEALMGHERAGVFLDDVVPGAEREELIFSRTGLWMFLIGIPFIGMTGSFVYVTRRYFPREVLLIALLGFVVMMGGALGVEMLSNFVDDGTRVFRVQVLAEEGAELIGVTVLLGAALALHSPGTVQRFVDYSLGRGRRGFTRAGRLASDR